MKKRFVTELDECRKLWTTLFQPKNISDLWEFRLCFHRYFDSRLSFLLLEDKKGIAGMMPLCYSKDQDIYNFFPGETWKGKTWIERTPIYLRDPVFLEDLFLSCPDQTHLRYMEIPEDYSLPGTVLDEIGYVVYPQDFDFTPTLYTKRFSNKKNKALMKVIKSFRDRGCTFHVNRMEDFYLLCKMNIERFGENSYLYDRRFRRSFADIMDILSQKECLHLVSLEIEGEIVAVDFGAFHNGTYSVFFGGTHGDYPGTAKVMNMYHIEFACNERFSKIDFLCGDFHWKKLWHLDPEPLFSFTGPAIAQEPIEDQTDVTQDYFLSLNESRVSY